MRILLTLIVFISVFGAPSLAAEQEDYSVLPKSFERTWLETSGGCYEYSFHPDGAVTYICSEDDRNPGHYSMRVYRGYGPNVTQEDWDTLTPEQPFIRMTTYGNTRPNS